MPDLSPLLDLAGEMPAYRRLVDKSTQHGGDISAAVLEAARPYLVAAMHRSLPVPTLLITARPENARRLYEQLAAWGCPGVMLFPEPDALPYERITSDAAAEWERVKVLAALSGCGPAGAAVLAVASAPAVMARVPLPGDFAAACHSIRAGMEIEPLKLLARWEAMGYRVEGMVEVPGTVSHRGGIIDIYPPASEFPARLEFFGNTVESIRLFDPASQRSVREESSITVSPATEMLSLMMKGRSELETELAGLDLSGCDAEAGQQFRQEIAMLLDGQRPRHMPFYAPLFNRGSLPAYLPDDGLLVLDEPEAIEQAVAALDEEAGQLRQAEMERGELPGNFPRPYFTWEELAPMLAERRRLSLAAWGAGEEPLRLDFVSAPAYAGHLSSFLKKLGQLREQGKRLVIVSQQASRLSELLDEEGIIAAPVAGIGQAPLPGSLTLVQGSLAEGWVMSDATCLFTDAEIFGFVKQRRLVKKRHVPRHQISLDINPDDYVVHVEHGIARFSGVTTMRNVGGEKEYLVLQYAAGDRLYVPADQIDRVSRYIGASDKPPALSRLGTQEWTRSKQRAQEAAEELA
ncbi:MAG: CarD family transcriptional regulator, partial [Chloroflexota bacterium]